MNRNNFYFTNSRLKRTDNPEKRALVLRVTKSRIATRFSALRYCCCPTVLITSHYFMQRCNAYPVIERDEGDQSYRMSCSVEGETNWKSSAEYTLTRLKSITIYQHQRCQKLWIHRPHLEDALQRKFFSLSASYPRKNYSPHFSSPSRDDNEINKLILPL